MAPKVPASCIHCFCWTRTGLCDQQTMVEVETYGFHNHYKRHCHLCCLFLDQPLWGNLQITIDMLAMSWEILSYNDPAKLSLIFDPSRLWTVTNAYCCLSFGVVTWWWITDTNNIPYIRCQQTSALGTNSACIFSEPFTFLNGFHKMKTSIGHKYLLFGS